MSDLNLALFYAEQLPPVVRWELEQLIASLRAQVASSGPLYVKSGDSFSLNSFTAAQSGAGATVIVNNNMYVSNGSSWSVIGGSGSGGGLLQVVSRDFSVAELANMLTTPVVIIPAPGPLKYIALVGLWYEQAAQAVTWTGGGPQFNLGYTGTVASTYYLSSQFGIGNFQGQTWTRAPLPWGLTLAATVSPANRGVEMQGLANYTAAQSGTGGFRVTLQYTINESTF